MIGAAAAATLAGVPVATAAVPDAPLRSYARARAAAAQGDVATAARAYAAALDARPEDEVIAIRAMREALASGDMALARTAADVLERGNVAPADVAVLRFADAAMAGSSTRIESALDAFRGTPLDFLAPMLRAWWVLEQDDATAVASPEATPAMARRYIAENRVLLDIAAGRIAEGVAGVRALGTTTPVDRDLRLNAAALLAGHDRPDLARTILTDAGPMPKAARGDLRFGASRLFARVATDLSAEGTEPLAIMLTRASLVLDPGYHRAQLPLADAVARLEAVSTAEKILSAVPKGDPAHRTATLERVRVLARAGDWDAAIPAARALADADDPGGEAAQLYGDILIEHGDPRAAAAAYARAIDRAGNGADWVLYLQQGGALEQTGEWSEALPVLRKAAAMAPDEPAVLNYLGYAQLERGDRIADATRLIERANRLRPDDPAIVDSLGWARFRSGDAAAAVPLLERAVREAPGNATIAEHLGDAYWRLGRRWEARYAWRAAAVAVGDDVHAARRLATKIGDGAKPQ